MLLLDSLVRFPNLTLCLLLVILLVRDARQSSQAVLAACFLATSIASSLHTMPSALGLPFPIYAAALFVSVPGSALLWWLARSILEDDYSPTIIDWAIMAAACLFKLGWSLQGVGIVPPAYEFRFVGSYVLNILLMLHIMWVAISGLRADLVEDRRRARFWFVFFVAATGGTNLIMELAGYSRELEAVFIHATVLPMLLWAMIWLTKLTPQKLFLKNKTQSLIPDVTVPERMESAFRKLAEFMEEQRGYTDQNLTIATLADKIGLPEHQLRRLINQTLGYRNFAAYLNAYRLEHAKTDLRDLELAQTPILTIAMDSGYKTLSTFNRAFRALENETPSDFRRRELRQATRQTRSSVQY